MMRMNAASFLRIVLFLSVPLIATGVARGQPNSWSNPQTGTWSWGTAGNWSLGVVPSISQSGIFITNYPSVIGAAHARTVTIDSTTPAGSLTISNLTE